MRNITRTFIVYGVFGLALFLQLAMVQVMGVQLSGSLLIPAIVLNGILLLVAVMMDPFGLLCVLLAWIPFRELVKFEIGIITFNPYTMGILVLGVYTLYLAAVGKKRLITSQVDWIILGLSVSYLVSTLHSETLVLSGFLAFHAIFIPVVSYFVFKFMVRTEQQFRQVVFFLVFGIVAFAVFALLQFNPSRRLLVASVPPISAAAMFTTTLIFIAGLSWWRKMPGFFALLASFAGLLSTYARGYLVLLLIIPFVIKYISKGKALRLMVVFLVVSLFGTLLVSYNQELFRPAAYDRTKERTFSRLTNINMWKGSIYGRAYVWADGFSEFLKRPLIGRGMYRPEEHNVRHNFHVEWLEYGGIIVYVLYCMVFITHFRRMRLLGRSDRYIRLSLTGIFLLLANGLTNSFTIGVSTYLGFILMGMNEARRSILLARETGA